MWNYRVVRKVLKSPIKSIPDEVRYAIHEAYYDDNKKVWAISKDPVPAYGESPEDLMECLTMMIRAASGDVVVLDYDKVPEEGAVSPDKRNRSEKQ